MTRSRSADWRRGPSCAGSPGGSADAFALLERFEAKLKDYPANVPRAATELAKDWRTDRILRRLEAMLGGGGRRALAADQRHGGRDSARPTGCSGSDRAATMRWPRPARCDKHSHLTAARDRPRVAADRRGNRHLHEHQHRGGGAGVQRLTGGTADPAELLRDLTPRTIVAGAGPPHCRAARRQASGGDCHPQSLAAQAIADEMRPEVSPKNILMIGPTGVGKTEIARRLAKLTDAPFIKVEATKYTEVGYYGRDVESMVRELVENAIGLVRERERGNVRTGSAQTRAGTTAGPASAPPGPVSGRRAAGGRRALRTQSRKDARSCWPPVNWTNGRSS